MKRTLQYFFFAITIFICSCGPSEEEIRRQAEEQARIKYEQKAKLETDLKAVTEQLDQYNSELTNTKAELEVANDEMGKIKEWQLLRTPEEREEQIRAQSIKIQKIEKYIGELENSIPELEQQVASIKTSLQAL